MKSLLIIFGFVALGGVVFVAYMLGAASATVARVMRVAQKTGFTGSNFKIYKEAIKILNGLVALDDITDLMIDPEQQVRIPPAKRAAIDALLARYRKENAYEE